jgi:transmembrane sensor
MEITRELIQKFFENKCDPDEFEAVMSYWQDHPEEAESDLGIKEWKEMAPLSPVKDNSLASVPDNGQAEMLEQLKKKLFGPAAGSALPEGTTTRRRTTANEFISPVHRRLSGKTIRLSRTAITAIAASFLLAVTGLLWIRMKNTTGRDTAGQLNQQSDHKGGSPTASVRIIRSNHTGKPLVIQLPDGSSVKLYDHSTLVYMDSFGVTQRDSRLEGEAVFTVAKDRDRPFTVVAGLLATTALGTSFGVKAPVSGGAVAVQLYTGRVVVRSTHALAGWNKDIYLSPGQQVSYDDRHLLTTVSRFGSIGPGLAAEKKEKGSPDLVFNNSSLKEVISQLSIQYHKKIIYRKTDVAGMNFTGTVPCTDSLGTFLKLLGAMNNLDIQEQPPVFIISRHKD